MIMMLFMLLVSLFIGTATAAFVGRRFLLPIRKVIAATKEIASGNFDIRVETAGKREIDRLAESFNIMAKELSRIEMLRADFIGNISHEFKTPIVSIRGFARRLKKDTLTKEQRGEYLDIIISESERLTRLSSNVLLLSSLESTEKIIDKEPYYLDEQIRKTVLLLEPQLQKKKINVDVDIKTVEINANEEMLSHLWINLLNNAVKFSPDGGTIKITLNQNGENAVVSISDTGIGMNDETKSRIFDKFYQGDPSRATEGNGLGLSLVKRILELDEGSITVDSEPGKGACFTVSLPIR
jgi:signal transduction histidine kinase